MNLMYMTKQRIVELTSIVHSCVSRFVAWSIPAFGHQEEMGGATGVHNSTRCHVSYLYSTQLSLNGKKSYFTAE